jgi:hypothetical protein
MKLGEVVINVEAQEEGAWVGEKYGLPIPEMGDLCLKVRGTNNRDWRALERTLIDAVPRKRKVANRLNQEDQDAITVKCLVNTCLLDWECVEGDGVIGEAGIPLPYDKKVALALLTDARYRRFRDAVIWAGSIVAEQEQATREDIAGN